MDTGPACVPNIGSGERRRRLRFGVVSLGVGALALIILIATGIPRLWRLALFLPFWAGALGVFQAREKT